MKLSAFFSFLPILRALNLPSPVANGLSKIAEGKACEDKDNLCTFVSDASSCNSPEHAEEVKRRCPKKCKTCPGMSM